MNKSKKMVLVIVVVMILFFSGIFLIIGTKSSKDKNDLKTDDVNSEVVNPEGKPNKQLSIVDVNSKTRPIAVMINNLNAARNYHSGLQDAYIVYEMIVEGGITRMMALYKDKDTAKIGSVRSSRHYYLDYALENDAIYVHFGWSPQAESDISSLKVNNINGLYDSAFWRDTSLDIAYEHTAYTSIEKIKKDAERKGYTMTSNKDLLLNYSVDEINLDDNGTNANSVDIRYSNYLTTNYIYNSKDKLYYRSVNDKTHKDYVTKKQYTAKNIIVAYVSNSDISSDSKGRQNLNNIGNGNGYYITNGVAVPITWEKKNRTSQTVYKYINGDEIIVNDGNTFIQIAPLNSAIIK